MRFHSLRTQRVLRRSIRGHSDAKMFENLESRMMLSITPVQIPGTAVPQDDHPLVDYKGSEYFAARDADGSVELFKTNGSTASLAANINPTGDSNPAFLTVAGKFLYFTASDGVNGTELWKFDGTNATMVSNINPTGDSNPYDLTALGNKLYFVADDGTTGAELWSTDGTTTKMVADINATGGSDAYDLTAVGSSLYFAANDGTGYELWKTSGSTAKQVADINPTGGSDPYEITGYLGKYAFFGATDGVNGKQIWATDGTTLGTIQLPAINPTGSSDPTELTIAGDRLYFAATDGVTGDELYSSGALREKRFGWGCFGLFHKGSGGVDLDEVTFKQVADINPTGDSNPYNLTAAGGTVFFFANNGTDGNQLYRTDKTWWGKDNGVKQLTKIVNSSTGDPSPSYLTLSFSGIYFTADDGSGYQIYRKGFGDADKVTATPVANPAFLTVGSFGKIYFQTDSGDGINFGLWTLKQSWPWS